jgi:hypothetical protein
VVPTDSNEHVTFSCKGTGTLKTGKEYSVAAIYRQGLSITGWTEKMASHKVWEGLGCTIGIALKG